jgi:glycosyltransferase involved in cell wall biosynthesis
MDTPSGPTPPRFSIVIPAFNEEAYLGECLASIAAQDYPGPVEVIVVDNNSTDGTSRVARAAGATVLFEPVPGVCGARQRGTEAATGEIVVSADADTLYSPGWLTAVDRWFRTHPESIAVGGPCHFHDGPRWGLRVQQGLFGLVSVVRKLRGPVIYITATNFAFRRDVWPGYDLRLAQGGDELDLLRRLRKLGPVDFDSRNASHTSGRRLEKGVVYSFAVSFFYYYILAYALNRVFRRPVLGIQPAIRKPVAAGRERIVEVVPETGEAQVSRR